MDLFSLTCTTCKSRLKVRDEGAIGHILACPKCGGMVMVKPPEGWQPGLASSQREGVPTTAAVARPADSTGTTAVVEMRAPGDTRSASNFDAVEDLLSDAPPPVARPPAAPAAGEAAGSARRRFVGAPLQPAAKGELGSPPAPPVAASDQAAPTDDEIPDWQPERPRRYWVLLAGSIAGSIALTVAIVLAINATRADPSGVAVVPKPDSGPGVSPATPPATNPATPSTPETTTPLPSDPAVSPMPPVDPMTPVQPPATEPADPNPQPADPATLPMPPLASNPVDPLERILAPDKDPLAPPPVAASNNKPPVPVPADPATEEVPAKPALPRPEPRTVDLAARLADPLPGIETDGTPLADFLQVMSELSTIPITLEPDALPLVQVGPNTPLTLKLANTTVGAAITASVRQLKLEAIDVEGQLVVRLAEPSPLRQRSYPVKDLCGGDAAQAGELAEMIQAMIEPRSWGEDDGAPAIAVAGEPIGDALSIRQSSAAHAQIIVLTEKLRAARGLAFSKSPLDPALFALSTRSQLAQSRLAAPITLNFSQSTSVLRILKRLEEAGGVRILVDWRDIAATGWNPDGEATLVVEKQPLAAALTALTGPMDLAWRVVDGNTLQLVRPETLELRCELEIYKITELLKNDPAGESLIALARSALGEETFRDGGGSGELRSDAAGQCLIASLPQPKQQQLEALLANWRSKKE